MEHRGKRANIVPLLYDFGTIYDLALMGSLLVVYETYRKVILLNIYK